MVNVAKPPVGGKEKFWALLAVLAACVVLTVMVIDLGIKSSILEEAASLRLTLERERGERTQPGTTRGTGRDRNRGAGMVDGSESAVED